mgnify:FL=1
MRDGKLVTAGPASEILPKLGIQVAGAPRNEQNKSSGDETKSGQVAKKMNGQGSQDG